MNGYSTPRGKCIVGDSLELLKTIDDNSVNLAMTSPPFALLRQKSYGNLEQEEYVSWLCSFGKLVFDSRFVNGYNNDHHHSGLKFLTPSQRRNGTWKRVLSNRVREVYEAAKAHHPERWNGWNTRDWTLPELVWLNPEKDGIPEKTILKDTRKRSA